MSRRLTEAAASSRPGDFDADGDVELDDYAGFSSCLESSGPGIPGCVTADFDLDGDADHADFAGFQRHFLRELIDSDGDRIADLYESDDGVFAHNYATGTDPQKWDTDGD
jgi:hypothetical protein